MSPSNDLYHYYYVLKSWCQTFKTHWNLTVSIYHVLQQHFISYLCKIWLASESALPTSFSCIFTFRTKHFLSKQKIYWKKCMYMASKKLHMYTILLSNENLDPTILCLCKILLAYEWAPPPHPPQFRTLWS